MKSERLLVRLSEEELALLVSKSEARGVSKSEYVRLLICGGDDPLGHISPVGEARDDMVVMGLGSGYDPKSDNTRLIKKKPEKIIKTVDEIKDIWKPHPRLSKEAQLRKKAK